MSDLSSRFRSIVDRRTVSGGVAEPGPPPPELVVETLGQTVRVPLRASALTIGGSPDCDATVAGLASQPCFRLMIADDGSAALLSLCDDLTIDDGGPKTLRADEHRPVGNGTRWRSGAASFQLRLPVSLAAAAANTATKIPARALLAVGTIAGGLIILATSVATDLEAALPTEPRVVSVATIHSTPVTPDGTLAFLRRRMIEAGLSDRITFTSTPDGVVYEVRAEGGERRRIEEIIDEARVLVPVRLTPKSDQIERLPDLVAAAIGMPRPRIELRDGRTILPGEVVIGDWRLMTVEAHEVVLQRGEELVRVDLRDRTPLR